MSGLGKMSLATGVALGAAACVVLSEMQLTGGVLQHLWLGDVGANVGLGAGLGALGSAIAAATGALGDYGPPIPPGFRFIVSATGDAPVHSSPSEDSPVVGTQPSGARVIYRNVAGTGGDTWYYVTPPGATPGWVSGENTDDARPTALPSTHPVEIIGPGLGVARGLTPPTAAAKG